MTTSSRPWRNLRMSRVYPSALSSLCRWIQRAFGSRNWSCPAGRSWRGSSAVSLCNRLRLTADVHLRTCLFSVTEHDLRSPLRHGATDEELKAYLREVVLQKE